MSSSMNHGQHKCEARWMSRTEKQIRLCMRIMHRLIRRWYEEQGITRANCPYDGIKQYGSLSIGYTDHPVCNLTLKPINYIDWYEDENLQ